MSYNISGLIMDCQVITAPSSLTATPPVPVTLSLALMLPLCLAVVVIIVGLLAVCIRRGPKLPMRDLFMKPGERTNKYYL